MRLSSILSLILVGWVVSILWAQGPPGPPPRQHGKPNRIFKFNGPQASQNVPEKTFIITSQWHLPKEDELKGQDLALDDALEKARDKVAAYVEEQKFAQNWIPKLTFVRDRLLTDLGQDEIMGEDRKGKLKEILIAERFRAIEETREVGEPGKETETRRIWLKVGINGDNWKRIKDEIQLVENQKRLRVTKSRMVFLVKFLVGIVALLVTACGYIRLDEWSKGYYTKWLKLAAVGCIAAVTVVLWKLVAYG
jgi:hypothetical protein